MSEVRIRIAAEGAQQAASAIDRVGLSAQRAMDSVGQASQKMHASLQTVGQALAAIGAGISAAAFAGWIKGAINAADEASKLAQKTGLATESVAGLTMAFLQSGAGGVDVLEKAMSRLSVELVRGNDTLKALGVTAQEPREALGQMADAFQRVGGGSAAITAAVDVFGRQLGASMIPLLQGGSKSLADFDEQARKLGLTVGTETGVQAERFNDTLDSLGAAMRGMATQAVAGLLPAMNGIAGAFLQTFTEGGRLQGGVEVLKAVLRGLFVGAAVGVEVFNTLGKSLGAAGAAVMLLKDGNVKGALEALRAGGADIRQGWEQTAKTIGAAFDGTGQRVGEAAADIARRNREARTAAEELRRKLEEQGEAAKEARMKHAEEARKAARAEEELRRAVLASWAASANAQEEAYFQQAEYDKAYRRAMEAERRKQDDLMFLQMQGMQEELDRWIDKQRDKEDAERLSNERMLSDWQRTVDQMGQSLVDALMQGGRSVAEYLRGLFRTLVLRPVLQPAASAVSSMIAGPAAASSGVGSVGTLATLLGGVGTFGTTVGMGLSATLAGTSAGFTAAGSLLSGGSLAAGAGMAVGAALPYIAAAVAVYSLFKKKVKDAGIEGELSAGGFSGGTYTVKKSILGGSKTSRGAFDDAGLDAQVQAIYGASITAAEALGLNADAMRSWTENVRISTKGLSDDEAQKKIAEALGGLAENLAGTVGMSAERLTQLSQSLQSVNNVLDAFAQPLLAVSVAGGEAAASLLQLAGGIDALAANVGVYYAEFFTEQEKLDNTLRLVSQALADVNLEVPATRDAFRSLVESLDLTTEADRAAYVALMAVAGAMDSVYDAAEAASPALDEVAASAADVATYMREFVYGGDDVAFTLATVNDVFASLGLTVPATRAEFVALVSSLDLTTESGRATHAALMGVSGSLAQVMSASEAAKAATAKAAADAAAERARSAAAAYESMQRERDRIYEVWAGLTKDIRQTIQKLRGEVAADRGAENFALLQAQFAIAVARAKAGDQKAAADLPAMAEALAEAAKLNARTAVELALLRSQVAGALESVVSSGRIPGFASGGLFAGGVRLVGERGPELEVTWPSRIHTADQLGRAMGVDQLRAELRAMRQEMVAAQAAIANYTRRAAQVLERSSPDGDALAIRTAA